VASGRHEVRCIVRAGPRIAPPLLVDARVRVRGAASTLYTARRQIVDVQLQTPGFEHVQVLSPPPADPFDAAGACGDAPLPVRSRRARPDSACASRAPSPRPGRARRCPEGRDRRAPRRAGGGAARLRPGDVLDVAGFPDLGEYSPVLRSAVARLVRRGPAPQARAVRVPEAMSGDFDGLPVEIEGLLVDRAPDREGAALVLRAGDQQFRVEVHAGDTRHLSTGSVLRVRGICLGATGLRQPRPFVPHRGGVGRGRGGDAAGDWWTLGRALWAWRALLVLLALGLVWNVRCGSAPRATWRTMRVLSGLLPICAWCKKIRDDNGYWNQVETYIRERSEADFSHGICPDCVARESGHAPAVDGGAGAARPEAP
jgi:hypothetical protein